MKIKCSKIYDALEQVPSCSSGHANREDEDNTPMCGCEMTRHIIKSNKYWSKENQRCELDGEADVNKCDLYEEIDTEKLLDVLKEKPKEDGKKVIFYLMKECG